MWKIEKIIGDDEIQRLPEIIDTPIFKEYQETEYKTTQKAKNARMAYLVYMALSKRENYYQDNSPTMFGDPDYKYLCGVFIGLCQAYGFTEYREDDKILIKKSDESIFMIVDKVEKTSFYHACVREISDTRRQLGI